MNRWGLFSFMNRIDLRVDEWLAAIGSDRKQVVRKVIVDVEAKWEIRDKLDGMNMSERVIMPGLDGLSTWLKRWYSPKSPHPVLVSPPPKRASARPANPSSRPRSSVRAKGVPVQRQRTDMPKPRAVRRAVRIRPKLR